MSPALTQVRQDSGQLNGNASAGDDALQTAPAIDHASGHHRLNESRGWRELQSGIGRQEKRSLVRSNQPELACGQTELTFIVPHDDFTIGDANIDAGVEPGALVVPGVDTIIRRQGRASNTDGRRSRYRDGTHPDYACRPRPLPPEDRL